ncbi:MAG: hypothetical protein EZS28_022554 [Streblomastix strix]|uniref:Uncharacterized protein n=1 Tax=Streblomastix strix TaxID=222440 RepID=A0A5J4VHW5_9EUKA|nr:MAG: hypothetical protein EZS28_022554 [Streblomastix strix]
MKQFVFPTLGIPQFFQFQKSIVGILLTYSCTDPQVYENDCFQDVKVEDYDQEERVFKSLVGEESESESESEYST